MAKKNGRPTRYTIKMGEEICRQIRNGSSLFEVCKPDGMPHRSQVYRWLSMPSLVKFRDMFNEAIILRADVWAEQAMNIADNQVLGTITTTETMGTDETQLIVKVKTKQEDMVAHRRLQIDTRLKLMEKMAPRKYGPRLDMTSDGEKIESVPIATYDMRPGDVQAAAKKANKGK